MAHKLLNAVTAVGTSKSLKIGNGITTHTIDTRFNSTATTEISAVTLKLLGSETNAEAENGIITEAGLVVGSTAEKVANIAFSYRIKGVSYAKTAVAAGTTLTAGLDGLSATVTDYEITASKFGGFKVYINSAGTIKMAYPALTQAYATVALANAAVDALPSIYGDTYIEIGKVLIENIASTWTATTDDLTPASDVTTVSFVSFGSSFTDLATITFTADEIANARAIRTIKDAPSKYVMLNLTTLTGTGSVISLYTPVGGDI